ncbi:hypothetical protein ABFX02_04G061800 [Erythranthe guttata]|uniref:protein TRAUCO-like n=1 Tax=Erythranthe guttata TaxID=4155 RepID=UPI00064E1423|nr:PREDICTED: protein TRAUCO-like [Erythranthe guttata]|eukprot:XP_012827390.1 PREDICTED: protein TRAUCO-like [Erythranthe guttata]
MDTLQATYRDDDTDEDSPPLPPPITAAATLANAVVVPDMKPELPEQNRVIDIKQHLEAAASEDVSPEEISSYGIETPGDADQIDKHGTLNSGDLPPEIGTDEVGEGGEVEEEEEEEEPPQKKQKTLPDLPKRETPDSKITEMPPPADAVPPPPRSGKPPTAKSGKKSKKKDVWTTTTRKGKKKTKHASNSSHSSKNPTYGHPLAEDRMLISPVPRFPDKTDDSPDSKICLSKVHKAEKVELSDDRTTASSTKGYRMVRATRGVVEGAWYFEIKVVRLGETGHTRLGWSTDKGDLQAPVGYDGNSFGYRDIDGSKVHKALREKYGGEGYQEGDVIGFYINLPDGGAYAPNPRCLVWHKGQRYVSAPDAKEEPPKVVPGSEISYFKNGISQGVAFTDICGGRYFPAASMYTLPDQPTCVVKFNFGPDFEKFPEDFGERAVPKPMIEVPYQSYDGRVETGVSYQ